MQISFWSVSKFVWSYARRHRGIIAILFASIILQSGLEIAMPYFIGAMTDAVTVTPPTEAFAAAIPYLATIAGLGAVFWLMHRGTFIIYDYFFKLPIMTAAGCDAFSRVQRFSTDWHANSFAGATMRRITRGFHAIDSLLSDLFLNLFPLIVLTSGIIIFFIVRWGGLGIYLAIATVIFSVVSISLVLKFISPSAAAHARADTRLGATIADAISCNATVKIFGREKLEDRIFARSMEKWRRAGFHNWLQHNWTGAIQGLLTTVLKLGLFTGSIWLFSVEKISIGELVSIFGFYSVFAGHIRSVGERIRTIQQAVSDMSDLVKFSLMPFHVDDHPGAKNLEVKKGAIEFRDVVFQYSNQKKPIYKGLNLKIAPGEKIALVGRSGGGKTTFVKLLQRLYDVNKGEILFDDQNIADVTQKSLRRAVGVVPQEPILFHRSLAENIAYGRPNATLAEIRSAARAAHAAEFIEKLPEKYETFVGERGVKLSGGERQRVAIARAMLADTPILILDEATSSLDSESETLISDALEKLMRGKTVIVVAHRLATIRSADRILVFENGQIVEEGKHASLLKKEGGTYRRLFELQAGGFIGE